MFRKGIFIVVSFLSIALVAASVSMAADQERTREQEQIYGSQLMTPEERTEHREKMRSFATEEEREQYRLEHHKEMEKRARERGVTLPDMPPASQGKGMGPGGKGYGFGGGKGR